MLSDEQREEEDAATRLQAISRGHRDRQAVERTQTLKKEREQAASLLQTRQRGRIACREVDERREQSQAATSIGKIYRGKQTRRARVDRGPRSCDRDDVSNGLHTLGRTVDLRHAYLGCTLSSLQLVDVNVLATYEHLQSLDISGNNLTSLAPLEHLPYLTRLNASGNKLSDFDVEVPRNAPGDQSWTLGAKHAGSNLIEVDLSDNAIEVLGAQETHRRLEKLVLDGNRMYEITGLANLARLKVLSMRNNDLSCVSGLETLSALVELDVSENRLTRLGEGLENLVNLRKLGVAQNQITTLDGLEPLQALDELDARDNCIGKVREVEFLERLPLFSSLLLQGNPCSDLPFYRRRVVFRLQQLRVLDGIDVTSDDKVKAINLHGGDESDLKHRRETFRKHFGSALEFEDPLPPFQEPERSPFDVDLCELPGLEMYLRTIFEAADTSGDGEISVAEAIKAVRTDDDFAVRPRRFTDTSMSPARRPSRKRVDGVEVAPQRRRRRDTTGLHPRRSSWASGAVRR
jgi:protein phosphatase 1 regulatory subunit 7